MFAQLRSFLIRRLEFEDTYDGLGDQLDETDDTFNDETFGGIPTVGQGQSSKPVGKDFDFFGQTAQVSDAINEEQLRYTRQQPLLRTSSIPAEPKIPSKPARTGYEKYNEPGYIPDLQANASLWGVTPKRVVTDAGPSHQRQDSHGLTFAPGSTGVPARKMMSLEEVEAAMRAQSKKKTTTQDTATGIQMPSSMLESTQPVQTSPYIAQQAPQIPFQPQILQRQQQAVPASHLAEQPHALGVGRSMQPQQASMPSTSQTPPSQPQRYAQEREHSVQEQPPTLGRQTPTRQILQNPNRLSASHQRQTGSGPHEMPLNEAAPALRQQGMARVQAPLVTHPQQLLQLSEEERAAFLMEDAKRAKRNHKIFLLSRGNGLMTPQDKNFITRIQLQQLVTATGNPNEAEGDSGMTEDFYYQVHSQIRGGPRQNPHQPLSNFAQTYLFQTGGRPGAAGSRRFNRAGDHHMQRMEQQVQRAVAAVKAKPKNKQLVLEGSLGKIAFSNAKTPKPLLNIKRVESGEVGQRPGLSSLRLPSERRTPGSGVSTSDRKSVLRQIEDVYATLMQLEDSERRLPPPPTEGSEATMIQAHMEWRRRMQQLNIELWTNLKVTDPIMPEYVPARVFPWNTEAH